MGRHLGEGTGLQEVIFRFLQNSHGEVLATKQKPGAKVNHTSHLRQREPVYEAMWSIKAKGVEKGILSKGKQNWNQWFESQEIFPSTSLLEVCDHAPS